MWPDGHAAMALLNASVSKLFISGLCLSIGYITRGRSLRDLHCPSGRSVTNLYYGPIFRTEIVATAR